MQRISCLVYMSAGDIIQGEKRYWGSMWYQRVLDYVDVGVSGCSVRL